MKRIVVPIDFSECSKNAVAVAAQIAKKTSAEIIFAHWYNKSYSSNISSTTSQLSKQVDGVKDDEYKKAFNEGVAELVEQNGLQDVTVKIHLFFDKNVKM